MAAPSNTTLVRTLALALPGATEQDHHGFPSFRVGGKIFATLPSAEHLHVMLDEDDILAEIEAHPESCEGKMWGKKLSALRVTIGSATKGQLKDWLTDAWQRRSDA